MTNHNDYLKKLREQSNKFLAENADRIKEINGFQIDNKKMWDVSKEKKPSEWRDYALQEIVKTFQEYSKLPQKIELSKLEDTLDDYDLVLHKKNASDLISHLVNYNIQDVFRTLHSLHFNKGYGYTKFRDGGIGYSEYDKIYKLVFSKPMPNDRIAAIEELKDVNLDKVIEKYHQYADTYVGDIPCLSYNDTKMVREFIEQKCIHLECFGLMRDEQEKLCYKKRAIDVKLLPDYEKDYLKKVAEHNMEK